MLVYKQWDTRKKQSIYTVKTLWEGWFLFGFIPLFVKQLKVERH